MKTRQEMIYDFMISLSTNSGVFNDWNSCEFFELGSYGDYIKGLAEELTDKFLENT